MALCSLLPPPGSRGPQALEEDEVVVGGLVSISKSLPRQTKSPASSLQHLSASGKRIVFANGDSYEGGWKNGKPHGEGVYEWADKSKYEGAWREGVKHGLGKYYWPSGAYYRGEWHENTMHGIGTLQSPDGARYHGNWIFGQKHGIGKKVYANGDVYEGLWKVGKADGPGRYKWKGGNEYNGEWRAGKMHGQGTMRWSSGDRYDGLWVGGVEDGIGIFTWNDGATYEGFWKDGKKHGIGVYRPAEERNDRKAEKKHSAGGEQPGPSTSAVAQNQSWESFTTQPLPSPPINIATVTTEQEFAEAADDEDEFTEADDGMEQPNQKHEKGDRKEKDKEKERDRDERVYVREYDHAKLVREDVLTADQLEMIFKPFQKQERKKKKGRKSKYSLPGETIFKGHRSYDLMLNLQLGIRFSVTKHSVEPLPGTFTAEQFALQESLLFPMSGSAETPPHPSNDFSWKNYCPLPFRKLREIFDIDESDYLLSICGDQALRELPSPGKSGSVFFLSHDDKFIIKTMRKNEVKTLLDAMPKYLEHVEKHPHTLLIKFYGLHSVTPYKGHKVRFVVMNNLFRTDMAIHRKYDLKGSTYGRFSDKPPGPQAILKDLNLDMRFKLEPGWFDKLMYQIDSDVGLMEELNVMDYSLLIGVHFRSPAYFSSPPATDREDEGDYTDVESPRAGMRSRPGALPTFTPAASRVHGSRELERRSQTSAGSLDLQRASSTMEQAGSMQNTRAGVSFARVSTGGACDDNRAGTSSIGGGEGQAAGETGEQGTPAADGNPNGDGQPGAPNLGAGDDPDLELLHKRISKKLPPTIGDQRVQDLLKLAHYKMLGFEGKRTPATVLSTRARNAPRHQRNNTDCSLPDFDFTTPTPTTNWAMMRVQLGMNMPAIAIPRDGGPPEDVILFFGVIDFLQEYSLRKQMEHRMKSLMHERMSISVIHPTAYAKRFQTFMHKVFIS